MIRLQSPIQALLQKDNAWWNFYNQYSVSIRPAVFDNIVNMLSCGLMVRGYKTYHCSNNDCSHTKTISFGCKSRFCPTCGKKATDEWVAKQLNTLPKTDWQHITFTIPDKLWPLFQEDRSLLDQFAALAADVILTLAKKKKTKVAIFTAPPAFGRDLKWHVHLHLSVTMGGLSLDHQQWKAIRFSKKAVMPMWRQRIIKMMRKAHKEKRIDVTNAFLDVQYHKTWIVHLAKPTANPWKTVTYLGRYIKKPPLSQARLEHYDGRYVTFNYLNHRTGKYQQGTYSTKEFIQRFIQHIPDKGFRMIRYYGILANRVRGTLLPVVYQHLNQAIKPTPFIGWAGFLKNSFGVDPLACILCHSKMIFTGLVIGMGLNKLKLHHKELATRKPVRH